MKFCQTEIPENLVELARAQIRRHEKFTTDEVRQHFLEAARDGIAVISDIESNQWIIANRVVRACINELRSTGEISQVKKGTWTASKLQPGAT
jgi:hypothetical protein